MINKRNLIILSIMILVGIVVYFFYQDSLSHNGRLYSSKQRMCEEFAQSYLRTTQKTDSAFSSEDTFSPANQKWEMAVDVETDLYNLCLIDLNGEALKKFQLSGLKKYENYLNVTPRNTIVTYVVEKGDTLSSIASKWGISEDTIRWANELQTNNIVLGQNLSILPVTGIAHLVIRGDTVESLASKYRADPQKIIDFPYNKVVGQNRHEFIVGETVIIPDGRGI